MKLPESWLLKSEKQIELERQGHIFKGQELLDNHEIDVGKPCYCGRPIADIGKQITD